MIDDRVKLYEQQTGQPFPPYEHLDDEECRQIRERLALRLHLADASVAGPLYETLVAAQHVCGSLNAEQPDFTLEAAFAACGIVPGDHVLVNHALFNNVDRMATALATKHFDDLWYPQADYVDFFEEDLDWVMSVSYDGEILVFRQDP